MNSKIITYCVACGIFFYVSLVPHTCGELSQPQVTARSYINQSFFVNPNSSTCVAIDEKHDHTAENDYGGQGAVTTYTTVSGTASDTSGNTTTTY